MAKTFFPLFSIAAAGSVSVMTYSKKPQGDFGQHFTRYKPRAPMEPRTAAQVAYNQRFIDASELWKILPTESLDWWTWYGESRGKNPRTIFISEFIIQRCAPGIEPLQPVAYEGGAF